MSRSASTTFLLRKTLNWQRWALRLLLAALVVVVLLMAWQAAAALQWSLAAQRAANDLAAGMSWPAPLERTSLDLPTLRDPVALNRAIAAFEALPEPREDEAWVQWQLARAYTAKGALQSASIAYQQALDQTPSNSLIAWEAGLVKARLLVGGDEREPISITEFVAAGEVTSPAKIVGTPYCIEGNCYIGRKWLVMPLSDAPEGPPISTTLIFLHSPATLTQRIDVPAEQPVLTFLLGLDPIARDYGTDGVTFQLRVTAENGGPTREFDFAVTAEQLQTGWVAQAVDLTEWANQRVNLTIGSEPAEGSNGNLGDWVGWAALDFESPSSPRVAQIEKRQLRAMWADHDFTLDTLLTKADKATARKDYERAIEWLELGRVVYDIGTSGISYERWLMQKEKDAADSSLLGDAIASDAGWVNMMQRGDAMRAWGNVMRESGAFAAARDLYATAAAMYEQNSAPQGTIAATYNQLATAQSQVGDLEGAVSSLLRAVALTPDQPDLQLALGRALLASDATRLDEARAAFDTALAAEPADANYAKVVLEAWQSVGADAEMAAVCQRLPAEAKNEAVLTLCQR